MTNFFLSLILAGQVATSSCPGRLGFSWDIVSHTIQVVHSPSPAASVGLQKGDRVLEWIESSPTGMAGNGVTLIIKRGKEKLSFSLQRAPY